MDKKALGYAVAAAAIAVAVYAAFQWGDFGYTECNGSKCDVEVSANAACTDKKAEPHKLKVKGKGADIFWKAPNGYQFCGDDAPKLKDPEEEKLYGNQFTNRCKTTSNAPGTTCVSTQPPCATYYHWTSVGDIVKKFEYGITITNTASNAKCVIDPWVKNG